MTAPAAADRTAPPARHPVRQKWWWWATMLAVVGDRYPQTGAVAMSIMGGIGMLSAGLIGGPGLGY